MNGRKENDHSFDGLIQYNATLIHEWTHWIQHNGTTFGAFQSAMRFTQELTALGNLRGLPQKILEQLMVRRKTRPIIFIDQQKGFLTQQKFSSHSDELNTFGQIWFELQWVQKFFDDSNIASTTGVPTQNIFGDAIGDIFIHYFGLGHSARELLEIREWYRFEDQIQIVRFSGIHLTSKLLMECGATLAEVQFLFNNLETALSNYITQGHFEARMKVLVESGYGIPLKMFLQILDISFTDVSKICATLNLIIFVALNPPLPPYSTNPPNGRKSWLWTEIYPPLRFIKAVEAVKKIGFAKPFFDHMQSAEYLNKIIEVSRLPTVIEDKFSPQTSYRNINFDDETTKYNSNKISFDSADYSSWTQKKFSSLRNHSLPFLANFANCLVGDFASKYAPIIIPQSGVYFTKTPFIWQSDEKLGFCYEADFCNSLIRQISIAYCLFDLVVGTGEYDLSEFSPQVSKSTQYKEFIEQNMYNTIANVRNG
jgi:hypothetical protein